MNIDTLHSFFSALGAGDKAPIDLWGKGVIGPSYETPEMRRKHGITRNELSDQHLRQRLERANISHNIIFHPHAFCDPKPQPSFFNSFTLDLYDGSPDAFAKVLKRLKFTPSLVVSHSSHMQMYWLTDSPVPQGTWCLVQRSIGKEFCDPNSDNQFLEALRPSFERIFEKHNRYSYEMVAMDTFLPDLRYSAVELLEALPYIDTSAFDGRLYQ